MGPGMWRSFIRRSGARGAVMLSVPSPSCQPTMNSFDSRRCSRLCCSPVTKYRVFPVETIPVLQAVGVIPARYRSVRFPGKVLADLDGRTLIEHVYRRAEKARSLSRLLVAADDERICSAVRGFGGEVVMTRLEHVSGTERLAEVAAGLEAPLWVNIQGDEPLVDPGDIDGLVEALRSEASVAMATLQRPIENLEDFHSPHVVKVVTNRAGDALSFSRAPIPFPRRAPEPLEIG